MYSSHLIYVLDSNPTRLNQIRSASSTLAEVRAFSDYRTFEFELKRRSPHLVCIDATDVLSADQIVRSVCEHSLEHQYQVYAFAERMRTEERIRFYELGVQDLIIEPCESAELRARLLRTLRTRVSHAADRIRCSNLQIWSKSMRVEIGGRAIELSALEFRLLHFFVQHRDAVLTRALILREVWKDVHVSARTIDSHVALLRKKLVAFKGELLTIYGVGYALRPEPEVVFSGDCDRITTCPYAQMTSERL